MNIAFYLTPKSEVAYETNDATLREVLQKMIYHKFTAIPILNQNGEYVDTVTEGDILNKIIEKDNFNIRKLEKIQVSEIKKRKRIDFVSIDANLYELLDLISGQNFVPVVDGLGVFIGIIKRSDIIKMLKNNIDKIKGL